MRAVYSKTRDILRLEEMPVVDFSLKNNTKIVKIKFRVFYDAIKIGSAKLGKVYFQLKNSSNNIPSSNNFSLEKCILSDLAAIDKNSSGSIMFTNLLPNQSFEKIAFTYSEIKQKDNPPEVISIKKHEYYDFYSQVFDDKEDPGFGKLLPPIESLTGNSTQETITQLALSSFDFLEFNFQLELNDFLDINSIEVSYISPDLKLIDFVEMNFDASYFYEVYKLGFSTNDPRGLVQNRIDFYRIFDDYLDFENSTWKKTQPFNSNFFIKRELVKDAYSDLQSYNFSNGEISIGDSSITSNIPFYYDENNFYIKRVPINVSSLRIVAIDISTGIVSYSNLQSSVGGKSITISNFLPSLKDREIMIEYDGIRSCNSLFFKRINHKFEVDAILQSFDNYSTMTLSNKPSLTIKDNFYPTIVCVEAISMYDGSRQFSDCKLLNKNDTKFENLSYDPIFGTAYIIHQIHIPNVVVFSPSKDIFSYGNLPHSIKTIYSGPQSIQVENETKIASINVIKTPWKTNIIQWKVEGDSNKIDHFRVYARSELLGVERLLGCTPNVNRFEDKSVDISKSLGKITYTVRPVFTNFNVGNEKSLSFERMNSLPEIFFSDFKQKSKFKFEVYGDSFEDLNLQLEEKEAFRNKLQMSFEKSKIVSVNRSINTKNEYAKDFLSKRIIAKTIDKNLLNSGVDASDLLDYSDQIMSTTDLTDLVQSSQLNSSLQYDIINSYAGRYMTTMTKKF